MTNKPSRTSVRDQMAQDGLTVGHLEKALTTAHLQRRMERNDTTAAPPSSQSSQSSSQASGDRAAKRGEAK